MVAVSAAEAADLASCMLQPALMGVDCPSVAETAAAAVFTHLDPAVRKVHHPSAARAGPAGGWLPPATLVAPNCRWLFVPILLCCRTHQR